MLRGAGRLPVGTDMARSVGRLALANPASATMHQPCTLPTWLPSRALPSKYVHMPTYCIYGRMHACEKMRASRRPREDCVFGEIRKNCQNSRPCSSYKHPCSHQPTWLPEQLKQTSNRVTYLRPYACGSYVAVVGRDVSDRRLTSKDYVSRPVPKNRLNSRSCTPYKHNASISQHDCLAEQASAHACDLSPVVCRKD